MSSYYEDIANTPDGWIETFEIMAQYMPNGMQTKFFLEAEHDIIYSHIDDVAVPVDSVHGKRLSELGWHFDGDVDVWAYFT